MAILTNIIQFIRDLSPQQTFTAILAVILTAFTTLYAIFHRNYSLDQGIISAHQLAPAETELYVEIPDPQRFLQEWNSSALKKNLPEKYQFASTNTLSTLLYFLQIKAGQALPIDQMLGFFNGSVGLGQVENGDNYLIAKVDLASRFGIDLAAALKATPVELQKPILPKAPAQAGTSQRQDGEPNEPEAVSSENYKPMFPAQTLRYANLNIFRIELNKEKIYFTMLDHFLVLANSMETVGRILGQASKPTNYLFEPYKLKRDDIEKSLAITYWQNQIWAGLLFDSSSGVSLFHRTEKGVNGQIYLSRDLTRERKNLTAEQLRELPIESPVTVINSYLNLDNLQQQLDSLNSKNADFLFKFIEQLGLEQKSDASGLGFVLHQSSLDKKKKQLTPQFSIAIAGVSARELVEKGFARKAGKEKRLQGLQTVRYENPKTSRYSFHTIKGTNLDWLSSSEISTLELIKAQRGVIAVLKDALPFIQAKSQTADTHIHLDIASVVESTKQFYQFGALKSKNYSEKTIKRDIMPLLNAMPNNLHVHISLFENSGSISIYEDP